MDRADNMNWFKTKFWFPMTSKKPQGTCAFVLLILIRDSHTRLSHYMHQGDITCKNLVLISLLEV